MVESTIRGKKMRSAQKVQTARTSVSKLPQKRPHSRNREQRIIRLARRTPSLSPHRNISARVRGKGYSLLRAFCFTSIICLSTLGVGVIGMKWLFQSLPTNNCYNPLPMTSDSERLYCIQLATEAGDLESLSAAMNWANRWEEENPLYLQGQQALQEWSSQVLAMAKQHLHAGNLEEAIAIVREIPLKSPLYPEAQVQIANWQKEWQQGAVLTQKFEAALKGEKWFDAFDVVESFNRFESEYWRSQWADRLIARLSREKIAAQKLDVARDLAKENTPEALAAAIAQVKQIDPKTHARQTAQVEADRWSRTILSIAEDRLKNENFSGAIATAQTIPPDSALYKEAQDWVTLTRAAKVAQKEDLTGLEDALEVVQAIDPNSPIFKQAKALAEEWQSQIQG
ncbi:hypothetical protein IQ249_12815 [Lusitaniella coriacea LEGE 07157]|uniref:Chromosome segregation ATPase n=1 Tax=Lusitaniella coriacea LEGE 07157 TaxID=945747 RepID=A0A8J7DWY2_9CYAN|nr:hypothetical protein [Lusitaniella coriacea]MBE9116782.1 hypothetical protein [Lusitaniella coriacea LEGE 07157]